MIPLVDLKAQYASIRQEIDEAVARVLESSQFILGDEVAAFEEAFAAYCGARYGVAVNSGTSALHLALLAAGVGPGDEVITVPFTFVATLAAIGYTGARPVLVDIEPRTYTMDVEQIEAAVTPRTKAILPVHLYGQPAEMDGILEIARRRNLTLVEDAAQAHGAEYRGRRVGSLGHLACFSFYPSKNLGAYGEGGMVVTSDAAYAKALRMLRNWGQEHKYRHLIKGYNFRMQGIQGAILGVKLRHLEAWTEARRRHADEYARQLEGTEAARPFVRPDVRHVYHLYTVRVAQRDAVQESLRALGIETGIHYPVPVHLQPAYADLGYRPGDFPCSEEAAQRVLSLPIYPELTDAQIATVTAAMRQATTGFVTVSGRGARTSEAKP